MRVNVLADAKPDLNHVVSAQHRARWKGAWSSKTSKEKNRGTATGKQTISTTRQPRPTKPPTEKKNTFTRLHHTVVSPPPTELPEPLPDYVTPSVRFPQAGAQLFGLLAWLCTADERKNAKTSSLRQRFTTTSATPYNHSGPYRAFRTHPLPVRRVPQRN